MLDRTIPFYNTIIRCDKYTFQPITLPDAYRIISYQPGFEQDWARLECSAGDFDSEKEAVEYFQSKYLSSDGSTDNLLDGNLAYMVLEHIFLYGIPIGNNNPRYAHQNVS